MTCPTCRSWCATSEEQLNFRIKNMERMPEVTTHVCPDCDSIDWATSREKIEGKAWRKPWWAFWR